MEDIISIADGVFILVYLLLVGSWYWYLCCWWCLGKCVICGAMVDGIGISIAGGVLTFSFLVVPWHWYIYLWLGVSWHISCWWCFGIGISVAGGVLIFIYLLLVVSWYICCWLLVVSWYWDICC